MKKFISVFVFILLWGALFMRVVPKADADEVADLKAQIEALQKRVDELENTQTREESADSWGHFNNRIRTWDPFAEMERMQEEMNRMFQSSFGRSGLNQGIFMNDMSFDYDFDVEEKEDRYEITFDMTGLDENKLDIEIKENAITVKGERAVEQTEQGEGRVMSSRSYGSFLKTIPAPADADTAQAKTEKKDNKLFIILPKKVT